MVNIAFSNWCRSSNSIFNSLYLIFAIPILMTIVYNDYWLTSCTAILSIIAKIVSEAFITWDPDREHFMASGLGIANFILSIFILLSFCVMSIVVIYFERKKDEANIKRELERYELKERVQIDELTGIHNRICLNNRFRMMEEEKNSEQSHYIFAIMDMDNFKQVNDTMGHAAGDEFCLVFKKIPLEKVCNTCKQLQSIPQGYRRIAFLEMRTLHCIGRK